MKAKFCTNCGTPLQSPDGRPLSFTREETQAVDGVIAAMAAETIKRKVFPEARNAAEENTIAARLVKLARTLSVLGYPAFQRDAFSEEMVSGPAGRGEPVSRDDFDRYTKGLVDKLKETRSVYGAYPEKYPVCANCGERHPNAFSESDLTERTVDGMLN